MTALETAPLHRRIYADIESRILTGQWRPGERVPSEAELCVDWACARMTANRALSDLAQRGLVVRRRRAGTFVAEPRAHSAVLAIPDLQAEIEERGQTYGYRLLSREARGPDPQDAEEVDLADGGLLLALDCLHSADGRPLAMERRLISLRATPDAAEADFALTAPGRWLLRSAPWTSAENRITAVEAGPVTARRLGVAEGSACLRVQRRTWREDRGVTLVWQTFPGGAYDLVARFEPSREDR